MAKKSRAASPNKTRKKAAKSKTSPAKSVGRTARPAGKKRAKTTAPRAQLGRPKVTGEEMLYMLFKEDYHARQIFDYLRVQTVKDLEQFSPQQIIKRLSQPITETVKRIRQKLAEKNRYLADDIEFAREVKQQT